MEIPQSPNAASEKGNEVVRKDELLRYNEDLGMVDYTPARKKTPIHN